MRHTALWPPHVDWSWSEDGGGRRCLALFLCTCSCASHDQTVVVVSGNASIADATLIVRLNARFGVTPVITRSTSTHPVWASTVVMRPHFLAKEIFAVIALRVHMCARLCDGNIVSCVLAECGNQRCELGEACSLFVTAVSPNAQTSSDSTGCCPLDCPIVLQSCIATAVTGVACSGHGSCLTGAGVCHCFTGYSGSACSACDASYKAQFDSSGNLVSCAHLPGSCLNGVLDGNEVGVDCGGECRACNSTTAAMDELGNTAGGPGGSTTTRSLTFVGIGVSALVAAVALVVVVVAVRRRSARQHCDSPGDHEPDEAVSPQTAAARKASGTGTGSWRNIQVVTPSRPAPAGNARDATPLSVPPSKVVPWGGRP